MPRPGVLLYQSVHSSHPMEYLRACNLGRAQISTYYCGVGTVRRRLLGQGAERQRVVPVSMLWIRALTVASLMWVCTLGRSLPRSNFFFGTCFQHLAAYSRPGETWPDGVFSPVFRFETVSTSPHLLGIAPMSETRDRGSCTTHPRPMPWAVRLRCRDLRRGHRGARAGGTKDTVLQIYRSVVQNMHVPIFLVDEERNKLVQSDVACH